MVGPMPLDAFSALRPGPGTLTDALESAAAENPAAAAVVSTLLAEVRAGLLAAAEAGDKAPARVISLDGLDAEAHRILSEVLGEGEVKAIVTVNGQETRVQESVMPGLWRVLSPDGASIEVGIVPSLLRDVGRTLPLGLDLPKDGALPEGAMNVLPVLGELHSAVQDYETNGDEREINLTLLPMTPVDQFVLEGAVGVGPVDILSLGYGNCRVQAGARRHLWRVRFFNSDDSLILDTLQVGDVPVAARATIEDITDSAERLGDILESLFG